MGKGNKNKNRNGKQAPAQESVFQSAMPGGSDGSLSSSKSTGPPAVLKGSPILEDGKRNELHVHQTDWDPMMTISESLMNIGGSDDKVIGSVLTGVGDLRREDILCPYNDGKSPGGCYKNGCSYKHVPYSRKVLEDLPKLQTVLMSKSEEVKMISNLPNQIFPADDCVSKAAVTCAIDPTNFYVIPEQGWQCLCSSHKSDIETHCGAIQSSLDTLEKLQADLKTRFFNNACNAGARSEFLSGELVAVRLSAIDKTPLWYRAKVTRDAVMSVDEDDTLFKPVDVEVQLLDYGQRCIISSTNVVTLPLKFCETSALAYKCQLFGISPICGKWSTSAIDRFRELVLDHYIMVEVVRTSLFSVNRIDDEPCYVNIYLRTQKGQYIDVAEDLKNSGYGIEWNIYPRRSFLNDILEGRSYMFALSK